MRRVDVVERISSFDHTDALSEKLSVTEVLLNDSRRIR